MPRNWIYFIALVFPLVLRVLLLNTPFLVWLWDQGYSQLYALLAALSVNPNFLEFVAGWPLPVFVITVFMYWISDEDGDDLTGQFLVLPIVYVAFAVVGHILLTAQFDVAMLYSYPLIIIACGYLYLLPWVVFVRVFYKLGMMV
jgi:hypothetical protein